MKANLQKLNQTLALYISLSDADSQQEKILHTSRVTARKLIVTMHPEHSLVPTLKKLIQASNKIRDLDVFIHDILPLFPKKLRAELTATKLELQKTRSEMNFDFKLLVNEEWDFNLQPNQASSITQALEFDDPLNSDAMGLEDINKRLKKLIKELTLLDLEDKHLHKIRLKVKRLHYQLARFYPEESRSIDLTNQLKEALGLFHDLYQAIKLIKQNRSLIQAKAFANCTHFLEKKKAQTIKDLRKDIHK